MKTYLNLYDEKDSDETIEHMHRGADVRNTMLRNVVGFSPAFAAEPYPSKEEIKKEGKRLYRELKGSSVITLKSGAKAKKVGPNRTWNNGEQYNTYVKEDGFLISF